jgi:hypothetical protein
MIMKETQSLNYYQKKEFRSSALLLVTILLTGELNRQSIVLLLLDIDPAYFQLAIKGH